MSDRATAVLELVRHEGLECSGLTPLRSTNNTVFLLDRCGVVAKVHDSEAAAVRELAAGHALAALGAPVVAPAAEIGDHVRSATGFSVTFWDYVADRDQAEPSSSAVAVALCDLHRHLVDLKDAVAGRTFEEQLEDARQALRDPEFGPLLEAADRRILRAALARALARTRNSPSTVLHGSPHRMNILARDGDPVFIDLETIQLGPVEWDLAHLEPEVADLYPRPHDGDLLGVCRTAVSAATATWCWGARDRGPDMRAHAEHHLAVVRATS